MRLLTHRLSRVPAPVRWAVLVPLAARCAAASTMSAVRDLDDALVPLDDDVAEFAGADPAGEGAGRRTPVLVPAA